MEHLIRIEPINDNLLGKIANHRKFQKSKHSLHLVCCNTSELLSTTQVVTSTTTIYKAKTNLNSTSPMTQLLGRMQEKNSHKNIFWPIGNHALWLSPSRTEPTVSYIRNPDLTPTSRERTHPASSSTIWDDQHNRLPSLPLYIDLPHGPTNNQTLEWNTSVNEQPYPNIIGEGSMA